MEISIFDYIPRRDSFHHFVVSAMERAGKKKSAKRTSRKTVVGIKLPPIEPGNEGKVKTIVDVDPSFYGILESRPVRPNSSIHLYKQNIKDVALKRTLHGFLVDEILRIEKEMESERNIFETASKHFDEYRNSFDKFLADDNNKTIAIMKKSDTLAKDLLNQTEEHKSANYEMANIKSKLQYTDETLLILLSFQNFLHKSSPILWLERENVSLDIKHPEIFGMDSDLFREIDIQAIKERLNCLPPAKLYFDMPEQLVTVFSMLEKQNLNYLLVTEELNSEKNKFLKALDLLKRQLYEELSFTQQKIEEIDELITRNEYREIEVKEVFFKILEEKIRYLVSSETALQILNYVEFTYEHLIAPNETKLNTVELMLALELEYDNLMMDISAYDLELVKGIEKEVYDAGTKEIKLAKEAAKMLKEVDKMSKRLKSSYEPSRKKTFE